MSKKKYLFLIGLWAFFIVFSLLTNKYSKISKEKTWEVVFLLNNNVYHKSAEDWDSFFRENWLDQIITWETKNIVLWMLKDEEFTKEIKILPKKYKDCRLPWWSVIKHWDSILAYQQRSDVSSICNIERRYCIDWKLSWKYTQKYCKENVKYSYVKEKVKLYNEPVRNEFIQPEKLAENFDWSFYIDGKIDKKDIIYTKWNNWLKKDENYSDIYHEQNFNYKKDCYSPWGEIVKDWQFIKSYEEPNWFVDKPCKVQLRYCVKWKLEWSFIYPKCKYNDYVFEKNYHWVSNSFFYRIKTIFFHKKNM